MQSLKRLLNPQEILFVADSTTGQDAVNSADEFHKKLTLTGVILTKMDGDARGGAALSIRQVTGQPIKFIGIGEKYDALEPFRSRPHRLPHSRHGRHYVAHRKSRVHDTISNAVITANAGGLKSVLGAHTYLYPGTYPVYVQVQSALGAGATVLSYVNVLPRPSVAFASPTNGQVMTNALAALAGAAADHQGVTGVWYQLNNGPWITPATTNSWTNWSATLALAAGTNTVQAYALNVGGITSLTNSLSVVSSNTFKLQLALPAAKPLATNGLSFNLQLSANLSGHIQVSTNLTSWTTLTNFTGTNATLQFLDPAATNGNRRFYRAVIP